MVKKSRGDKSLGKESLTVAVSTITRWTQDGRSVAVTLTRSSSSSATWMMCPPPTIAMMSQSGMTICVPPPT